MFQTIYSQIGTAVAVLVVAFAFLRGDEPERLAAAAYALIAIATLVAPDDPSASGPRWGAIGRDVLLIAVFLGLAWKTRRTWLFWATAFQSLIVAGHVLVLISIRPPGNAFITVNNMASYGLLGALAIGTFWAWQERRAAAMGRDGG